MNYHMIRYVIGQIMKLGAALMGLPLLVSLYYLDEGMIPILTVMLPLGILGYIRTGFKPKNQTIYAREGFVIVALAWVLLSVFGAACRFCRRAGPHIFDEAALQPQRVALDDEPDVLPRGHVNRRP